MRSGGVLPLSSFFCLGCFPLHKLRRVELVVLGEKYPQGVEISKPFLKHLGDVFGLLEDIQ